MCACHDFEQGDVQERRYCKPLAVAVFNTPSHWDHTTDTAVLETPEHVQASTGLAPTPPDKMPASRFRYSPNASPRPCRDACAPHSAPLELPARADRYWPCTHAPPIKCLHHDSDTARMLVRDHVAMRVHPTAHRRTGDACTYRPVLALHPRPPIKCLHHDSDTARMLVRDHVAMRA